MVNIIPKPSQVKYKSGVFTISPDCGIKAAVEHVQIQSQLADWIMTLFDFEVSKIHREVDEDLPSQEAIQTSGGEKRKSLIRKILNRLRKSITKKEDPPENLIDLQLDASLDDLGSEGYDLEISSKAVTIRACAQAGLFYGVQSVRQLLLDAMIKGTTELPCLTIRDIPRFPWRGFMFDSGRHYHPVETLKKILDILAILKMNVFHWHLTEDQGWRVEIKKYPGLTEIGSKRVDTKIVRRGGKKYRGQSHEGYYTQEEVREVVAYAAERHIQVVPELEIPGHCSAALAAYPELSCTGKQIEVPTNFGVFPDIYCAGKASTLEFLGDVLDELIELFPSDIVHIGGDEAPKKRWKKCPDCQGMIKSEGLKDEHELQVYFTNQIGGYLKSKGKRLMGWNQILHENLDTNVIAQWWAGNARSKMEYLRKGYDFVMSPATHTYSDYNYFMSPMRKFYNWDPVPKKLETEFHKHVLGPETPIWTEWVPDEARLGWQVFPRLMATAEVGWTAPEGKDYADFKRRVPNLLAYLDMLGMPYADLDEVDPNNFKRFGKIGGWMRWPEV
jgi:hexosaminidase